MQVKQPKFLSFTEWDKECQAELINYSSSLGQDSCVFGDISSFWRDDLQGIVKQLRGNPSMALEALAPYIVSRKAVKRTAYCLKHRKECYLRMARSHTSGTSCTAHSRQGLKLGLNDPNVLHMLCWIALRLEIGEPEALLENVEDFPSDVMTRLLGDQYFIECIQMDPRMYGCFGLNSYKVTR